jgi:GDPmannose 4,6-dehydratase
MQKIAFLTGCTGQDASYLAEQLIEKGYDVHGLVQRSATFDRQNIDHIGKLTLHYGDLTDYASLVRILTEVKPDEIYNLGAMSHVGISWEIPCYTAQVTGVGVLNLLEATRMVCPKAKFYQASTSEMFSGNEKEPQNENTPLDPQSPYSASKLFAHQMCKIYRKAYGMFICCGILFNHESERRGKNFVTRKITIGISDILKGKQDKIHLGNIEAQRDWGYAPNYTEAMWLMLQQDKPDDYVIATGEMHSIKDFLEEAFKQVKLDWKDYVVIDDKYFRPSETEHLCGDASKAKEKLGWKPKTSFKELVKIMVQNDIKN